MNSTQRVIEVLEHRKPDMVPVFENIIDPKVVKELLGEDNVLKFVKEVGLDAVTIPAKYKKKYLEDNIFVDEFGVKRKQIGEDYPMPIDWPIKSNHDLKNYDFPEVDFNYLFKDLIEAKSYFANSKAIIFRTRDVFSHPRDLIGYENFLMSFYDNKKLLLEIIKKSVEFTTKLAQKAYDYGADAILLGDDYADNSGIFISPDLMYEMIITNLGSLVKECKKIGLKVIKHTDGNIMKIIEAIIDTGIDCLDPIDPIARMDLKEVKQLYGDRICLKGNVNCATTLVNGTKEEVVKEVKNCLKAASKGGSYVLSSSNSIHNDVKLENFLEMVKAAREYGKY
jgi:uroporphyrinogen decarboxylase